MRNATACNSSHPILSIQNTTLLWLNVKSNALAFETMSTVVMITLEKEQHKVQHLLSLGGKKPCQTPEQTW